MTECHVKHYLVVAGNIDHNTLSWCLELTHKYLYLLYIHIYKSLKIDNRTALVLKGFVIDKAGLRQKPESLCQTSYGESEASCPKCVKFMISTNIPTGNKRALSFAEDHKYISLLELFDCGG